VISDQTEMIKNVIDVQSLVEIRILIPIDFPHEHLCANVSEVEDCLEQSVHSKREDKQFWFLKDETRLHSLGLEEEVVQGVDVDINRR
jgi:hypothetical protein